MTRCWHEAAALPHAARSVCSRSRPGQSCADRGALRRCPQLRLVSGPERPGRVGGGLPHRPGAARPVQPPPPALGQLFSSPARALFPATCLGMSAPYYGALDHKKVGILDSETRVQIVRATLRCI